MKIFYLIASLSILSISCNVQGSFGGLVGYQKTISKKNPNLIITPKENVCEKNYEPSKVFLVNGKDLNKCIANHEKALVHIWKPNCKSKLCIPLKSVERIAKELQADLFIVAEYYDLAKMEKNYQLATPILGIDTRYYKTSFTNNYMKRFLQDLIETNDVCSYNFFLFEKNNLVLMTNNYKEL